MGSECSVNTLRPRQNACHFPDGIFKRIFLNEWKLRFVPNVRINNMPALVQMTAWYRSADKPLSEPMMVSLLTYIYVTWTTNIHFKDKQHLQENFKGQAMDYPLWVFLEKIDYVWTAVHCTNSDIDWNFHCQHCHPNSRTSLQLFFSLQIKLEGKVIPFFPCKIVTKDQSHNALNTYPTMHHFVTEMCTHVHISDTKWCIVGYRNWCIVGFVQQVPLRTCYDTTAVASWEKF